MKSLRRIVFYTFLVSTIAVTAFALWFFSGSPGEEQMAKAFPLTSHQVFTEGKSLTLYALDPKEKIPGAEDFRGFSVRGKTEIRDRGFQNFLKNSFIKSLSDEASAKCFNPRHGLRISDGKRTTDVLICFECRNFEVYFEGNKSVGAIDKSAEVIFDKTLADKLSDLGFRIWDFGFVVDL
jgi:hypothetical protein